MNRRELFRAAAAASASGALRAQTQEPISAASAEAVADPGIRFFAPEEFAALERLSDILMPAAPNAPGALAAGAAAFLDFLLSQSDAARQQLYKRGIAALNGEARRRYAKSFASLSSAEAAPILAPLAAPWTYDGPSDPFARFLTTAKEEVWHATLNSREWSQARSLQSRAAGGMGLYWLPAE
jgi:hypothetical protein